MIFFDTHSHVNISAFLNDADAVIKRALNDETSLVIVGTDYKSSKRAIELANKYQGGVYAAVGLHPEELVDHNEEDNGVVKEVKAELFSYDMYSVLAKFPKVVAIGEIGLDYNWRELDSDIEARKRLQKEVFWKQLELSRRVNKPAIIHCRQAHDDLLPLLTSFRKEYKDLLPKDRPWGVIHCFSGDENLAWEYFNLGLLISFTGLITFSQRWDDLIRKVPENKLMIETDSPFMAPEPHRGKRNEPVLVKFVAQRMAEIRGVELEKIAAMTTANAKNLFKL
jgi:TatD DNase family protein